ncbi:MAG TPA: hypothetical protein VGJ61_00575 [Solirubrobacterales bacterium]
MVNVDVPRSWQGEVNSVLDQAERHWGPTFYSRLIANAVSRASAGSAS